ncbi:MULTISPECIES: cupin domain-containing protein [Actinosynnema]|uniref:cupin domain-containing protein n=1 Tax=Actinosynnema TaxID=40566 RepID=UPI0020A406AA|nr:cupin domain-containing protein [Actinosynnema pretiosum]MCP2094792.1 Cupin domain-containing protein [Actinosynnema pretiosum]
MSEQALPVLVADVRGVVDIGGVHGAEGTSHWKGLASRRDLRGQWEAVELARVPPGGVSGEHRHTRTEEVYFVLSGQGEMVLDGQRHRVRAGCAVLTGLGTVHGLRNTGSTDLDWITIEVLAPATTDVQQGRDTTGTGFPLPRGGAVNAEVHDLTGGPVDTGSVFTGPLRRLAVRDIAPGERAHVVADGVEHTLFVLSGAGLATGSLGEVPLRAGVSVTLPLGTAVELIAGDEGLRHFHAELDVPEPRGGGR